MSDSRKITPQEQRQLLEAFLYTEVAKASDEQLEDEHPLPYTLAREMVNAKLKNSQIRNVESLVYTTNKFSDITDLLKKLVGRSKANERWAQNEIGSKTIDALKALRPKANMIIDNARSRYPEAVDKDPDLLRQVHLKLCREFVKHLAAEFMYKNPKEDSNG